MSERYIPAVGDMVRMSGWAVTDAMEVTAVGRAKFLAITAGHKCEISWHLADDWVQVVKPEPLPETWVRGTSVVLVDPRRRDHFRNDVDHVEIERVTK
jgi:hypothetical protein